VFVSVDKERQQVVSFDKISHSQFCQISFSSSLMLVKSPRARRARGCNLDSRTFFRDFFYFLNEKYKIFRILKDGLYPINRYKETCELFMATNFLAEHR
jgi:hypothetical protein